MASNKTAFAVGLFMIVGLAIAVTAIIWLGMSNYFEKGQNYVAYFDESVQGLDRDSPVKYRGVAIGRVKSVGVAPDGTLIEVILTIEEEMQLESDMYAQLKSVGITGIMFIEIDRKKEGEPDYHPPISFYTEYPIVVVKPSGIKMLMDGMDEVLDLVSELDTKGISHRLKRSVDRINQIFEDAEVKGLSSDIRSSLAKIDKILEPEKWDRIISSLEKTSESLNSLAQNANQTVSDLNKNMNKLSANANKTISSINNTVNGIGKIVSDNEKRLNKAAASLESSMENADIFLDQGTRLIKNSEVRFSTLQRHLLVTLQNLEKASENLDNFVDTISDQPSQLIFGHPIPSKKIED
ncbi:MlaD family protein [Desulfonema magnum]|uniref:MlaD protein domain-containing protein n=1 Tax=Desulfonema magnum TaxID=45655 RepID=A0A975BP66_9BACT|nr:MlaD family protein [Desulfonema magnum]QTA89314.1 MlaD protein domain-containing protein [Desulfonema magnum]